MGAFFVNCSGVGVHSSLLPGTHTHIMAYRYAAFIVDAAVAPVRLAAGATSILCIRAVSGRTVANQQMLLALQAVFAKLCIAGCIHYMHEKHALLPWCTIGGSDLHRMCYWLPLPALSLMTKYRVPACVNMLAKLVNIVVNYEL